MSNNTGLVIAAMSGGVDSSVTAARLLEWDYDVVGVTLKIWENPDGIEARAGTCCSLDDINDARRTAEKLGISHYVLNARESFRQDVVNYFTQEYVSGRTPNPCVLCNQSLKFDFLFEQGRKFGANKVATGHYARLGEFEGYPVVLAGSDLAKDQSYYLFSIAPDRLGDILFPLGDMDKAAVRQVARGLGLNTADKPESQEICFVPDNDYKSFIRQVTDVSHVGEGEIVDERGNVIGCHTGYIDYTIGQRRGLGISNPEPLYVIKIDPDNNRLEVGGKQSQYSRRLIADGLNWYIPPERVMELEISARIRSRHTPAKAQIIALDGSNVSVEFEVEQMSITPGQAVVFYHNDVVLGGGWIKKRLD